MEGKKKTEEEIRFDNEVKKLKLKAEYGAHFGEGDIPLPAELESQWLEYITDYENFCKKHGTKKVKQVIGQPTLPLENSLSDEEIPTALNDLLDLLHQHEISLSVLYDTPDRDIYKFITEELLEEEMQIIPIPGMFTQFIYEEFHPNDIEDLRNQTEEFLNKLVSLDFTYMDFLLSSSCQLGEEVLGNKVFIDRLKVQLTPIDSIKLLVFTIQSVNINNNDAKVDIDITYEVNSGSQAIEIHKDNAWLKFKNEYGYWGVHSLNIPGIRITDY